MKGNYNIEVLKKAMELINENRDSLTDEQKKELDKGGNSVSDIEAAFKEYDEAILSLQDKVKNAFK